jgi:hypothetical protein
MGLDLSLRLWYGYIIILMVTISYCVVNALGILGMDAML